MMKKIDFYILKKFIGTFFFAVSLLMVIIIVFDLSENIDAFLKHDAPWQRVAVDYYLTSIPYYINQFIHLFVFISVIFFTSKMANRTEVVAILSSGISFRRFLVPYVVGASLLALMSLYLGNFMIPHLNVIRREFKDQYIEHLVKSSGRNIHIQTDKDEYVYVETYDMRRELGYRFAIERYRDNELVYKMASDVIYHDSVDDNKWRIDNYTERYIDGDRETIVNGRRLDTVIPNLKGTDFYNLKEDFEEMAFFELRDHIALMKQRGLEGVRRYEVEMHQRMAQPAALLILTLIGVALSSRKMRGGMGMHLGLGITIAFSYILFVKVAMAFGINSSVSPGLAAWIPNILYCALAVFFLAKAPK
ncbi:MAG: LptF/LptG family permease [Bacteroidales bacterium]|nr:LptF/LptG family permease [Bacteroidales bacterium]